MATLIVCGGTARPGASITILYDCSHQQPILPGQAAAVCSQGRGRSYKLQLNLAINADSLGLAQWAVT